MRVTLISDIGQVMPKIDWEGKCTLTLLSNATVGALIRNVGPSESMIRLSFNMAAASHTWFRNEEF